MSEQELKALADSAVDQVCERLDPQGYGWASGDGPTMEEVVGALVAMGWRPAPEALLDRLEAAEAKVSRVEALIVRRDEEREKHALMSDCGCSYKDCYECGKWCRCIHTPYAAVADALSAPQTADAPEGHGDADEAGA